MRLSTPVAFIALCAGTSLAARITFLPDTVCAGNKANCTTTSTRVLLKGADTAVVKLQFVLSPLPTATEVYFVSANPQSYLFFQSKAAPVATKKGYRFTSAFAATSNSYSIKLKSRDTARFSDFRFGTCLICAAVASRTVATPSHLGNGERVGLLFGPDTLHLDTLWAIANNWISGGTLPRATPRGQLGSPTTRDALGRQWTTGTAATIEFTSSGSRLSETP
jgi:hypothetical protein